MSQAFCCAEKRARLSDELRPTVLGDLGLKPALEFLAEGVSKRTKQRITVEGFKASVLPRLKPRSAQNRSGGAQQRGETRSGYPSNHSPPTHGKRRHSVLDNGVGFDLSGVRALATDPVSS